MNRIYLLFLSGCLLLIGCGKEEQSLAAPEIVYRDSALRGLLDVDTISGRIEIPPNAAFLHVTYLKFLEGEYLGTGRMRTVSMSTLGVKSFPVELLIRNSDMDERAGVLSIPGGMLYTSDPFLRQEFSDFTSGVTMLYGGYNILGFASSYDSAADYDLDGVGFGSFENSIKKKRRVLAIGVKFTETKEEADQVLPENHEAKAEPVD